MTPTKSLAARLAIREGETIFPINAPKGFARLVGKLPADARIITAAPKRGADEVHLFVASKAELEKLLPKAIAATKPGGSLWVSYPKKTAGDYDLSREDVRGALMRADWKPIAQVAVDDTWSAIRGRPTSEREVSRTRR